jgi:autophagy-related protein 9
MRLKNKNKIKNNTMSEYDSDESIDPEPSLDLLLESSSPLNSDIFLTRLYNYYCNGGFIEVILKNFINIFSIGFIVYFTSYLGLCIDYNLIHTKHKLSDIIIENCYQESSLYVKFFLYPFIGWFILEIASIIYEISFYREISDFYKNKLKVSDSKLKQLDWYQITDRIARLNNNCTPIVITNKIMRYDNYLIAIYNNKILDLSNFNLTNILQFNLNQVILKKLLENPDLDEEYLRKRCFIYGILNLLLLPFSILLLSLYLFFRYAEEYRKNPSSMSAKMYSIESYWKFRDYNELSHFFKHRLNMEYDTAVKYTEQSHNKILSNVSNFIVLISGSFTFVLASLTILDGDLLFFEITPKINVLFYIGLFGGIFSIFKGFIPLENAVYDPAPLIERLKTNLHYYPKDKNNHNIHKEFSNLFIMRLTFLMREFYSLLSIPYILWMVIPKQIVKLKSFIKTNTCSVENIGKVFKFSLFTDISGEKMMDSMLQFKENHPTWNGNHQDLFYYRNLNNEMYNTSI